MEPIFEYDHRKTVNPDQEWLDFKKNIHTKMLEVNNTLDWETSDCNNRLTDSGGILDIIEMVNTIDYFETMKVYPFKHEGLRFDLTFSSPPSMDNFTIIKACKKGFHRDWKHDAICVKDINTDEIWKWPGGAQPPMNYLWDGESQNWVKRKDGKKK